MQRVRRQPFSEWRLIVEAELVLLGPSRHRLGLPDGRSFTLASDTTRQRCQGCRPRVAEGRLLYRPSTASVGSCSCGVEAVRRLDTHVPDPRVAPTGRFHRSPSPVHGSARALPPHSTRHRGQRRERHDRQDRHDQQVRGARLPRERRHRDLTPLEQDRRQPFTVRVVDTKTDEKFRLAVRPDQAIDAFRHPFVYAQAA